jgi:hypothetical protein
LGRELQGGDRLQPRLSEPAPTPHRSGDRPGEADRRRRSRRPPPHLPFRRTGTTSETYFNHFSLLATVEELFALERLGYAAEPAITGFDESVFNAAG